MTMGASIALVIAALGLFARHTAKNEKPKETK